MSAPPLYTSLVRLKQAMGGAVPPMTPLPEHAKAVIDPAFTINGDGLGGLVEDAERGLRCPVRGCGTWRHRLTSHLNARHANVGGAEEVRRLLDIPRSVALISTRTREALAAANRRRDSAAALARWRAADPAHASDAAKRAHAARGKGYRAAFNSTNLRNLRDACPAQLGHRIIDLHNRLGRSPSADEARAEFGPGFVSLVQQVFGSWNNAKAQCGLEHWKTSRKKYTRDQVLDALQAWYDAHGALPSALDARRRTRAPLLMHRSAILDALNTTSWPEAMRRAAAILDIYGGRWGLPESVRREAAA